MDDVDKKQKSHHLVLITRDGLTIHSNTLVSRGRALIEELSPSAANPFQEAAEQGDTYVQRNLGDKYYYGNGVPQDYKEAAERYRKAAEQGCAEAQNNLGVRYLLGEGVPQDYKQAAEWYRKAAEQGHARAQYELGDMYYHGEGVHQDYNEAAEWYRKAAEQGHVEAQFWLAGMYHGGETINRITKVAISLYQELGRESTLEEVFHKAGLPLEKVRKVMEVSNEPASIEAPIGDDDSKLDDFIADTEPPSPFDELVGVSREEEIDQALSALTPREEKVIRMRLGIGEKTDYTLEVVADVFGLTAERIRQIEAKALRKLKHPARRKRLERFLE